MVWLYLSLVAVLIALDKSLLPGTALLGIAFLANVFPAKEATGVTLILLIVADWVAIWAYRDHVAWKTLRRLLPNVVVGVAVGAGFLFFADDLVTRKVIGVIIVVFVSWSVVRLVRARHSAVVSANPAALPEDSAAPADAGRVKSVVFGSLAGFTTMVANAGGPVTSMYFMTSGFPVRLFLGTTAWFYLIINMVKLPFSLGLGMVTVGQLPQIAAMIPIIVLTVYLGRWLSGKIALSVFNGIVIALTLAAGVLLLAF